MIRKTQYIIFLLICIGNVIAFYVKYDMNEMNEYRIQNIDALNEISVDLGD